MHDWHLTEPLQHPEDYMSPCARPHLKDVSRCRGERRLRSLTRSSTPPAPGLLLVEARPADSS